MLTLLRFYSNLIKGKPPHWGVLLLLRVNSISFKTAKVTEASRNNDIKRSIDMSDAPQNSIFDALDNRTISIEKRLWKTGINAIDILRGWGWKILKAAYWLSKWLLRAIFKIATPIAIAFAFVFWAVTQTWWALVFLVILVGVIFYAFKLDDGETFFDEINSDQSNSSSSDDGEDRNVLTKVIEALLPRHFKRSSMLTKTILIFILCSAYATAAINYFFSKDEGILSSGGFRWVANVHHWIIDDLILGCFSFLATKLGFQEIRLETNEYFTQFANNVSSGNVSSSKVMLILTLVIMSAWFTFLYGKNKNVGFLIVLPILWIGLAFMTNLTFFAPITTTSP